MLIYRRLFVFWICMYTCLLTEGIVYLGCYQDSKDRVLEVELPKSSSNTPRECARRCSNYRYAGVEYGAECFCGNTLIANQLSVWGCARSCPGDKNLMCGGWWYQISVYTNWACGSPPEIANGKATLRQGNNITYGSIADVFCNPGFISTPTISCLSNKSWENATCEKPGSSTTAVSAGISIAVAIAIIAVVIVLVLRNKKKACFTKPKKSKLGNRDDVNHITLPRVESKQTAYYKKPGTYVSNKTNSSLQNASTCTKDAGKHNPVAYTDVTYPNTNIAHTNHDYDARAYFVLEKYGFEQQRRATNAIPADVHDYFVLEKQHPNIGKINGVSKNEVHPYFMLEKEGDRPFRDRTPQEGNAYFVIEKQTNGNSPPIETAHALELENYDGDTYQEIDTNDTYSGIDDSREDNTDYDYTNKGFNNSRKENSDNIYNHLKSVGDEYDHVGKRPSNVNTMENNYDVPSGAVKT